MYAECLEQHLAHSKCQMIAVVVTVYANLARALSLGDGQPFKVLNRELHLSFRMASKEDLELLLIWVPDTPFSREGLIEF